MKTENTHIVVKIDRDWADEFDVVGFSIFPIGAKDIINFLVQYSNEHSIEHCFGTNEDLEGVGDVEIVEVTDEEAKTICKVFCIGIGSSYGTAPGMDFIAETISWSLLDDGEEFTPEQKNDLIEYFGWDDESFKN